MRAKRNSVLLVRLTQKEKDVIKRKSAASGTTISEWVRQVLRKFLTTV